MSISLWTSKLKDARNRIRQTYLMFAGGSMEGTNSSATYARPVTATIAAGIQLYQCPPIRVHPMKK